MVVSPFLRHQGAANGITRAGSSRTELRRQPVAVTAAMDRKKTVFFATVFAPALVPIPAVAIQAKQAEVLVEKLFTSLTTQKVLDKITTVITGQTTIEPETLIKVISEEPDDAWEAFKSNFFDLWATSVDFAVNFDPANFAQTSWELLAEFGERFATWELSSLVALGERWLIWTPIVILPMAWQMNQQQQKSEEKRKRQETMQLSDAAKLKQEQVSLELRRIELRSSLLDAVNEAVTSKERVEKLARELASIVSLPQDAADDAVKGETWQLIYATQIPGASLLPQLPGFEITNLGQRHEERTSFENLAVVRLGPLGAVEVRLEATPDLLASSVSLKAVGVRLVEMLGRRVTEDLPDLIFPVPEALRQTMEWRLLYADESLRINQADNAHLYLFERSSD